MHQKDRCGIEIESVVPGSLSHKAGIVAGDRLLSVGGNKVSDMIDYLFHKTEPVLALELEKAGRVTLEVPENEDPGMVLKHFPVKKCGNRCAFCFIGQLPKGMRKTLYLKDEDYRMSFLYGNYITMANLTESDKKRIARQKLSPLYISVHSTDNGIRRRLLGNPKAPDVMKDLKFFMDNRLRVHAQIVLCPDINSGRNLEKTIRDLYSFYPYVLSVAVVPVGLTAYARPGVRPVDRQDALDAVSIIGRFQKRFMKNHGENIVYGADELYIKAGSALPPLAEYGELPQIENGVGMVPLFLHDSKKIRRVEPTGRKYLTFTGVSFYPYLKRFIDRLNKRGHDISLAAVANNFFGPSITATGLLTGRDVITGLGDAVLSRDILLVPETVVKEGDDMFLDDVKISDIEAALGIKTKLIEATAEGLITAIGEKGL